MSVLLATTTIEVKRMSSDALAAERYSVSDADFTVTVATGIPANIGDPRGQVVFREGQQSQVQKVMQCDPMDLQQWDQVRDLTTGLKYITQFVSPEMRLGLDHLVVGLTIFTGAEG